MSNSPTRSACSPPRRRRPGARCCITLIIVAVCRNGPARCAEQAPAKIPMAPMLSAPSLPPSLPPSFTTLYPPAADAHTYSETDFSPRKRSLLGSPAPMHSEPEVPRLRTTTVWQSLNQFRSRDRVRLVTLWESAGSSVSLQAGRKGNPSLQWTSKWMNRGGATRGLLDQIVAAAVSGAGASLRPAASRTTGISDGPSIRSGLSISAGPKPRKPP